MSSIHTKAKIVVLHFKDTQSLSCKKRESLEDASSSAFAKEVVVLPRLGRLLSHNGLRVVREWLAWLPERAKLKGAKNYSEGLRQWDLHKKKEILGLHIGERATVHLLSGFA